MDVFYKREDGSKGQAISFHDENGKPYDDILTKQEFLEESDINVIIARFQKSGVLPNTFGNVGSYGDFSQVTNFQDAIIKVQEAEDMFMSLPARIRAKFDNDPSQFLEFADNPENQDALVEMGVIDKASVKATEPAAPPEAEVSEQ